MKRLVYLLGFSLFLLPAVGLAVNWPSGFTANPVQDGIKLEWLNNTDYSKQILIRTDKGPIVPPQGLDAASGLKSFTDPNLNRAAVNGITTYQYQLQTTKGDQIQTDGTSVTFLDSNIVTVTTQTGGAGNLTLTVAVSPSNGGVVASSDGKINCGGALQTCFAAGYASGDSVKLTETPASGYSFSGWSGNATCSEGPGSGQCSFVVTQSVSLTASFTPNTYSIQCGAVGSDAINISWYGQVSGSHHLTLYGANSFDDLMNQSGSNKVLYDFSGVGPGPGYFQETGLQPNTQRWYLFAMDEFTNGAVKSDPITCTTNPTLSDTPTFFSVFANSPSVIYLDWKDNVVSARPYHFEVERIKATPLASTNFVGTARSASSVSLGWKNITQYAPYDFTLERSTSSDANIRFSSADPSFNPNVPPPHINYHDPLNDGLGGNAANFSYTDSNVGEATVYYYRLKACFPDPVAPLYMKGTGGNVVLNDGKPAFACSDYAGSGAVVATTTQPVAPSNLVAATLSPSSVELTWKDNSAKEQGFRVFRNGTALPASVASSPGTGKTVTYTDSGLLSGTAYTYTVASFIADPLGGGQLLSALSNESSATTQVTLDVARTPAGGGSVIGNGIDCGSACSSDFNVGDTVTLTEKPSASYSFSGWTGDVCNGSTGGTCSFTINSDTSVRANFTLTPATLIVSPPTGGTVSGSGINCGTTCSKGFNAGDSVSLTATQAANYEFTGWTNCPNPNGNLCSFAINRDISIRASFTYLAGPGSGDVNNDGIINCTDVSLINQIVLGTLTPTPAQAAAADVDGNHIIQSADASLLMKKYNLSCPSGYKAPANGALAGLSGAAAGFVNSVGIWQTNVYDSLAKSIAGGWREFVSGAESGWRFVAGIFRGLGTSEVQAVSQSVYDAYFALKKISVSVPSYADSGLDASSTYIYRARVSYDDGASPAASQWSLMAAGNTLPNLNVSQEPQTPAPVCTANSFCDRSITTVKAIDALGRSAGKSESQCQVNANCANVGRSSKTFKEQ